MKITKIKLEDWHKYTHEAVFGSMNSVQELRDITDSHKGKVPYDMEQMLSYNHSNPGMLMLGARVALLYLKWQEKLDQLISKGHFPDRKTLNYVYAMKNCSPDGFNSDLKFSLITTCENYRLCPWCRYRLVHDQFEWLGKHLQEAGQIAVVKFSHPMQGYADLLKAHTRVVTATCKERNNWIGDYTITLPAWVQTHDYVNQEKKHAITASDYLPMWETSILVFAKKDAELILPENAISERARNDLPMDFASPHGWLVWNTNTKQALQEAMQHIAAFPNYLWAKPSTAEDFVRVLEMKGKLKAVGHGVLRRQSGK